MKQRAMKISALVSTENWAEEDVRSANVQNPNVKMNISIQTANVRIPEGAGQAEEFLILTKSHHVKNLEKVCLIRFEIQNVFDVVSSSHISFQSSCPCLLIQITVCTPLGSIHKLRKHVVGIF